MRAFVIALVGAESTGKTTLADALVASLAAAHRDAVVVSELLREFCDRAGRTPRADEQLAIAEEQTRRIECAADRHQVVIADTTALMTAVYSDWVFGDGSLYSAAEAAHARSSLTLLMGLDLPWQADGHQRDGPQVRGPVDTRIRAALVRAGVAHSVLYGTGDARLNGALAALRRAEAGRSETATDASRAAPPENIGARLEPGCA